MTALDNPPLEALPLRLKYEEDTSSIFSYVKNNCVSYTNFIYSNTSSFPVSHAGSTIHKNFKLFFPVFLINCSEFG